MRKVDVTTSMFPPFLLILTIISSRVCGQFLKCCEQDEELNEERKICVKRSSENGTSIADILGENLSQDGIGRPKCTSFETFQLSGDDATAKVFNGGLLSTNKYKNQISTDKYCVDFSSQNQELYALSCDRCKTGIPCISLCCPHGYVMQFIDYYENSDAEKQTGEEGEHLAIEPRDSEDSEEYISEEFGSPCVKADVDVKIDLKFKRGDQDTLLDWAEDVNYILIGPPKDPFSCPMDEVTGEPAYWIVDTAQEAPTLFASGVLHGVIDHKSKENITTRTGLGQYCVTYYEDTINTEAITYGVCQFELPTVPCEKTREIVFNTGFTISLIFIALAIIAHLIEPQLRDSVFGKISICYLLNLFMAFAVVLHSRVADYKTETRSCIWIGYLQQYFFIAFFAWINAMAIFFCTSLGSMKRSSSQKKPLIAATLYAQGLPLVVCLITYGVDLHTPEVPRDSGDFTHRRSYPEMGVYSCYLGSQKGKTFGSYFTTPEFIYVQSFQLVLLICNLVCFVLTARTIFAVTANARPKEITDDVKERRKQIRENVVIVLKLYIYMVCVWMFEIVTSAIVAEHGSNDTCLVRFVLDTPNAFYGLIIFGVLVCSKVQVRRSLKDKLESVFTSKADGKTSVFQLSTTNPSKN